MYGICPEQGRLPDGTTLPRIATAQRLVRRVDDGVDGEAGDVAVVDVEIAHDVALLEIRPVLASRYQRLAMIARPQYVK